jgi:hypothetical protein
VGETNLFREKDKGIGKKRNISFSRKEGLKESYRNKRNMVLWAVEGSVWR